MHENMTEMELLVFSAGGFKLAVETSEVDSIMSIRQAEKLGVSFITLPYAAANGRATDPLSGTVIFFKSRGLGGFGIEGLEEIATVSADEIRPMPQLIRHFARLFWGAVIHGTDMVLIIDPSRLRGLKTCIAV